MNTIRSFEARFLKAVEKVVKEPWKLYETCGQSMFTVYGGDGSLTADRVAYIYSKPQAGDGTWLQYGVLFTLKDVETLTDAQIESVLVKAQQYKRSFNPEGGDLGMPQRIEPDDVSTV